MSFVLYSLWIYSFIRLEMAKMPRNVGLLEFYYTQKFVIEYLNLITKEQLDYKYYYMNKCKCVSVKRKKNPRAREKVKKAI